ncbi:MAG: D-sedoheptulose 7-phosphate isomerase [Nitrospirota bacterium]|nr:MAG: D-sedoheptulose 7-phosphate isomerase [Nitrospirota bacterium]
MKDTIIKASSESIRIKKEFFDSHYQDIIKLARSIAEAFNNGKKILIFGNGGSGTDASHIAAEFVNRFKKDRPSLPAISLNTDTAVITSIANDYDFSDIFSKQIKGLGAEGDIALGITTSGNSKNVIKAIDVAKKKKLITAVFTGQKGKKFASRADHQLVVPSTDTPRIQETHITLGHIICELVEEILFEAPRKK